MIHEFIRNWVMTLTGTGIVVAVALALTPEGTIKKIVRMGAGIVLLLATLSPLVQLNDIEWRPDAYINAMTVDGGQEIALQAQKAIIADRLSAYISAEGDGLAAIVTVEAFDDAIAITGVEINYPRGKQITDIERVTRRIAEIYGIPAYKQTWRVQR